MDFYLSLENCKKLKEWGCDIETAKTHQIQMALGYYWTIGDVGEGITTDGNKEYPAYHILEDICVKYAKKFFGTRKLGTEWLNEETAKQLYLPANIFIPYLIMDEIRNGDKERAEDYFIKNTVFNPSNK